MSILGGLKIYVPLPAMAALLRRFAKTATFRTGVAHTKSIHGKTLII
jgi:hypothetical protein